MIELKNITKTYQMGSSEVKALAGISLKIRAGELVAIMGPSGSGKSTLMHILGFLDRPDSGEYFLGGRNLTGLSDKELAVIRNRFVGFIFQQFHLLPRITALENTELPLIYAGKRSLKDKAREKLELIGLKDRQLHRPNELSGGQQQRVAIARALVNEPVIIMADEPTGNLDSKSRDEIISILKRLNKEGKTVVIVTHEKEIAENARRIIYMRDGQIISDNASGVEREAAASAEHLPDNAISDFLTMSAKGENGIKFLDYFREAIFATIAHKMRSALSILGVLIGVAAVIAMLALGEGAKISIEAQLASLGSNLLVVRPGSSRFHGVSMESGSVMRFTFQDVEAIKKLGSEVKRISSTVSGRAQIVYGNKNWNTQVQGVDVDYAQMRASVPVIGRFFTDYEVKMRQKEVVLGTTVARELFGDADPTGETIKINLINFRVVGILPSKGASPFHDQDDIILVPVTTAMYRLLGKEYIDTIYVEAQNAASIEPLTESITNVIVKQHRLGKGEEDSFQIRNMSDIKDTLEATTKTMSFLLGAIAAISLLVGGIGIMNIMLVSVTERTREIGLRKAIGANDTDIMIQFLIEAVLMSLLGGLGGIVLGSGISLLITLFAGWTVKISTFSIVLATTFSLAIGVVFGLWPAKQASQLNPIEALRYE
ncbi:MAG: ABC transporter permease [Candidatus Omnitrophica bacterium]|nr:ABC transporter permease [Candidatus Omnitrophota bacterium]